MRAETARWSVPSRACPRPSRPCRQDSLTTARSAAGLAWAPTWPTDTLRPSVDLDHIVVANGMRIVEPGISPPSRSGVADHSPEPSGPRYGLADAEQIVALVREQEADVLVVVELTPEPHASTLAAVSPGADRPRG